MVTFNIAYTAPVNPPGTTPALTPGQIWKGLQRKIRRAQDFVPVITECEVLSETRGGEEVLRRVRFAEGHGPPGWVEERCVEYAPIKVNFHQQDGSVITNVISEGEDGVLQMTYIFEWLRPEIEAGSAEYEKSQKQYKAMAKTAVDKSIVAMRKLAEERAI